MDDFDNDADLSHHNRSPAQQRAYERHMNAQMSTQAYTLLMPVRAHPFYVIKAMQYEARRNGTMPSFATTLRTMLLWIEVNMGRSDDDILDTLEDELARIRKKHNSTRKEQES